MKKLMLKVSTLVLLSAAIFLSSCTGAGAKKASSDDLYESGLDVIAIIEEMIHSESYVNLLAGNFDFEYDEVKHREYATPTCVYSVSEPSKDVIDMLLEDDKDRQNWESLSPNLKDILIKKRMNTSNLIMSINNSSGSKNTILASIFTANKKCEGKLGAPITYIYTYTDKAAVAVRFEPFGNEVYEATGMLLFKSTSESLEELFEPFGCKVEKVK